MSLRLPTVRICGLAVASFALLANVAAAAVTPSILTAAEFPTSGEAYTFNPNDAATADNSERTVLSPRFMTQTFQVPATFDLKNLYLLIARGQAATSASCASFPWPTPWAFAPSGIRQCGQQRHSLLAR